MQRKKLINSFKYAFNGIYSAFKTERNMKIHVFFVILVVIMGLFFHINEREWITCIILFALVISAELFNTAIEEAVDLAMPNINNKAKLAKDVSAGGVLVLAIASALIGIIIFLPKIINFLSNLAIYI